MTLHAFDEQEPAPEAAPVSWDEFPLRMKVADICRLCQVGKSTVYRWRSARVLPPEFPNSGGGWPKSTIRAWFESHGKSVPR